MIREPTKHEAMNEFHLPVRPYSPIDALNRRAAAVGSPRYAAAAHCADYNGHHVTVRWNDYRGYYTAEYWWAGRVVLARGSFADCLRAALREYDRGALGASVTVCPKEGDMEALEALRLDARIVAGPISYEGDWYTWRHRCAAESARDVANPGSLVRIFNWELMQAAENQAEYEAAIKAQYGRVWQ